MNSYTTAGAKDRSNEEIMGKKRQEKALREFKQVLEDLVFLLRSASEMETVYMYWVNRSRGQFVMETKSTVLDNVMFKDRISFEDHFLNEFKDVTEPVSLEVGKDIPSTSLSHYYNEISVRYVTLLPFVNNGETVAITVLESSEQIFNKNKGEVIYSYINALRNMLNTYLEISDLYGQQEEWTDYESCLDGLDIRCHHAVMVNKLLNIIQGFLHEGGVSFITKGTNGWCNVMNSGSAYYAPNIGMGMEERTMAHEALEKGEAEFAIHFNNNPKRLSPRELHSEGATLAIPFLMDDRRHGVILVYDKNPLLFKESTKHKLINLVRIAGLKIRANAPGINIDEPIFLNKYRACIPDIFELTVDSELDRLKGGKTKVHSWVGLITLANLPELRTKLRLEELNQMQEALLSTFGPQGFGFPGILGYHSDYVYSFFLQNKDPEAVKKWTSLLKDRFLEPLELKNGVEIETGIKVGFVKLDDSYQDSYQLVSNAKAALSQALKSADKVI